MSTRWTRREVLRQMSIAGALVAAGCVPSGNGVKPCFEANGRKVRWLVPFPPGGGYDIYSRLLEPYFRQRLGVEIIVENTPGAGGAISANKLKNSAPDGLTLGLLNAPGLLVASLAGETNTPNPTRDFTILGRLARNYAVWVTGGNTSLETLDHLLAIAGRRPLHFAISEAGSTNFVNSAVAARLLGIEADFLAGYSGSRETSLAVMRGEADVAVFTFESIRDRIEAGDLRPVLQISEAPISDHDSLVNVPVLGGEDGMAAMRARLRQDDEARAVADAKALTALTSAGLLVAAPPGMEEGLFRCLEGRLHEALNDAAFQAAAARAGRSLNIARGDEALAEMRAVAGRAEQFVPIIREVIERIRG